MTVNLPENQRLYCRVCGKRKHPILTGPWTVEYECHQPHYLPILPEPLSAPPEPGIPAYDAYAAWAAMQADREAELLTECENYPMGNQRP